MLQVNNNPVVDPRPPRNRRGRRVGAGDGASAAWFSVAYVGKWIVVDSRLIVELPLNARQVTQLITLWGFAVVQTAASPGLLDEHRRPISVAGGPAISAVGLLAGRRAAPERARRHRPYPAAAVPRRAPGVPARDWQPGSARAASAPAPRSTR